VEIIDADSPRVRFASRFTLRVGETRSRSEATASLARCAGTEHPPRHDQRVDVICCGGDLFEHDRVSRILASFCVRCLKAHIPSEFSSRPATMIGSSESLYGRVRWSPNVYVFEQNRLVPVTIAEGLTLWGSAHRTPAGTPNFLGGFKVDRGGVHVALFHGSEQAPSIPRKRARNRMRRFEQLRSRPPAFISRSSGITMHPATRNALPIRATRNPDVR